MRARPTATALAFAVLFGLSSLTASGPLAIYGVVEKVVFEPGDRSPERIQVWGAFAYADGAGDRALSVSSAKRGYLYFTLPSSAPASDIALITNEWNDLRTIAGTGQAVAFGTWSYIGSFRALRPDAKSTTPPYILERAAPGSHTSAYQTDLRVRPASERPSSPSAYQTNVGVVKLSDQGSHAAIVKELKDTLKR